MINNSKSYPVVVYGVFGAEIYGQDCILFIWSFLHFDPSSSAMHLGMISGSLSIGIRSLDWVRIDELTIHLNVL